MLNLLKSLWQHERRSIVTGLVLFGLWVLFVGKHKYGWKGANKYV